MELDTGIGFELVQALDVPVLQMTDEVNVFLRAALRGGAVPSERVPERIVGTVAGFPLRVRTHQERVQQRTLEQADDVPGLQLVPQERVQQRPVHQDVGTRDGGALVPHERVHQRTAQQFGEVRHDASLIPQERVHQRTADHAHVSARVQRSGGEKLVPQERMQQRTAGDDVHVPAFSSAAQCVSVRNEEHVVGVLVPQARDLDVDALAQQGLVRGFRRHRWTFPLQLNVVSRRRKQGLIESWQRWMRRRRWERRRSYKCRLSRFQGAFRPRRLCPNLLRDSRCHFGSRCTFAHAFHELEAWRD